MTISHFFFISVLSIIIISTPNFTHAYNRRCLHDQKTMLLELKNELTFSSFYYSEKKLAKWNQTDDCCSWDGVGCDAAGHVISLDLDYEGISGGIDGKSSSLFGLKYLEKLDLAFNFFNGARIPRGIGNLTHLTHLDLSYAGFGGEVPVELSLLSRLVSLHLSGNSLILNEHLNLTMLLLNLTGLRELYLDEIDISIQGSEWSQVISFSLHDLIVLSLRGCSLQGPLDPSLLKLQSLSILQLGYINLTRIPDFFAYFSNLTTLSLRESSLQGSFPEMILQVPTLQELDLSNNLFTGLIPPFNVSKKLKHMDLSGNRLNGSLSSMHFEGLSNLVYLSLGYNSLSGSIPQSLFGLHSLDTIMLNNNQFNDTFQMKKIQRLPNLSYLDLSHNKLSVDTSDINSSFSTLAQLKGLALASCNLHSFPDLRNQSNMYFLDLSNNWITGEIPNWIWGLGNGELLYLNLSYNLLVDLQKPFRIPNSLWVLDLHSNMLQVELRLPILHDIINITSNMFYLSLANNNLSGSIPTSLCNATRLDILDLSINKFSGGIPPCLIENNVSLEVLNLGTNNLTGDIPDRFSVNCTLHILDFSNNNLGGNLPKSLGNCKSLVAFNVGNNNINGSFPCMLPPSLRLLVLRSNRFHGELTFHKSLTNLQIIDISFNNFSGYLNPINFSSWRGMTPDSHPPLMSSGPTFFFGFRNEVNYYQYELMLTIKGLELKLVKIRGDFVSIDFSCNNFQGTIPDAIGDLGSLYLLNLSQNALTGPIPKSFRKLRQLESLDLSVNQLTGVIPTELAGLSFLSFLNLSHNKLVGMIPKGRQFQTFFMDSFQENTALCGLPLNISCSNNDDNDASPSKLRNVESHGKMEIEWDYVSAALGYVVGLGSFLWILVCCQSLRERYFEKVDEVLDMIFDRQYRKKGVLRNQVRRR